MSLPLPKIFEPEREVLNSPQRRCVEIAQGIRRERHTRISRESKDRWTVSNRDDEILYSGSLEQCRQFLDQLDNRHQPPSLLTMLRQLMGNSSE